MRNKLILLLILLTGLWLRVYGLNRESLWTDEGISIRVAQLPFAQIINDRVSHFHTPLYFIILHYWISLFGDTESDLNS